MKKRNIVLLGILLLFVIVVWMMFQPLMSSYISGNLERGPITVYGIGFLNDFGAQGVFAVALPFLLLLLVILDVENPKKECAWWILNLANALAYVRSLAYAKQWLCTEVSWNIKCHAGVIAYPMAMFALAGLVFFWLCKYDGVEDEYDEEEEAV